VASVGSIRAAIAQSPGNSRKPQNVCAPTRTAAADLGTAQSNAANRVDAEQPNIARATDWVRPSSSTRDHRAPPAVARLGGEERKRPRKSVFRAKLGDEGQHLRRICHEVESGTVDWASDADGCVD
jgi:hypothetical protein